MLTTRRHLLRSALGAPALLYAAGPDTPLPVMSGDVVPGRALLWGKSDKPGQMMVRWREARAGAAWRLVNGPVCTAAGDFTARQDLTGLPPGAEIEYEVRFEQPHTKGGGRPAQGRFRTAPAPGADVRFFWSGDTVGQGWGINPAFGGLKIYEVMRRLRPDFFLHSGDTIYADNPVPAEVKLPDGTLWKNVVTEVKSKPAQTLDDFRGAYKYNWLDENFRRFHAEVPQIWQWDDHEVKNNWSPGSATPEMVRSARQAFLEYAPIRTPNPIYRHIPYGPLLDVFVIDMRSYRAANGPNLQTQESAATAFLGATQFEWLLNGLRKSRATWKVIASDMPIGLLVGDGKDAEGRPRSENSSNGDGPALGRELEMARLLRGIRDSRVRNTVWLTADVHYTAAHYYDPAKAQFTEFEPFWEFISGPLHAGTFGPGALDNTFGPQVIFHKHPPKGQSNLPPSAGLQFFGEVSISGKTRALTVRLRDIAEQVLYEKELPPVA